MTTQQMIEKIQDKIANYEIEWKHISLSRVLSFLWLHSYCFFEWYICDTSDVNCSCQRCDYCCWIGKIPRKLLNEDWSDAYLQDQSDQTIQALHTLIVR